MITASPTHCPFCNKQLKFSNMVGARTLNCNDCFILSYGIKYLKFVVSFNADEIGHAYPLHIIIRDGHVELILADNLLQINDLNTGKKVRIIKNVPQYPVLSYQEIKEKIKVYLIFS